MTNQMKNLLIFSLVASGLSVAVSIFCLFYGEFGFLHAYSYIVLVFSILVFVSLLVLFSIVRTQDKLLKQQIGYYKLLKTLRDNAVLDFYNRFKIKPQYNKEGKILTPDELLGIITKLDSTGKLDMSIYEQLGILPIFDENGKEIPIVLVLKHLIKSIKQDGLKEIKKLQGLYAKGTKKIVNAVTGNQKSPQKGKTQAAAKSGGKKKKGSASRGSFLEGSFKAKKKDDKGKKNDKGGSKSKSSNEPDKKQDSKPKTEQSEKTKPQVVKVDTKQLNKEKETASRAGYKFKVTVAKKTTYVSEEVSEEVGEFMSD